MDIFWSLHKIGLYLGVINDFYAFEGLFLRSGYRIGDSFFVAKISFFSGGGCLKFLIFLGVNGSC